mgnify:CR=1 FL=1
MAADRMLSDEILLGLINSKSGGGGGGTGNYNDLSNQPQIGGITLKGNKSASDLGLQREVLYGATDPTGGEDGDLYLKTTSASNADVFGTPSANTGDGYEITTDVTAYGDYQPFEGFGNGIGFGKNSAGRATLIYHITSGKKYKPKSVSLCNNFDVVGGYLTSNSTVISGSIDGTNWTQLATITTLTDKDESITEQISTNVFYSYFKFEILANTGYPGIKNIVLVGESDSEEDNKIDDIFFKQDGKWLKDSFAKKSAVKNEFIGTTAQWNALTAEQRKEYDTYQITDDYTEGGGLKYYSESYVGNGNIANTLNLQHEPKFIIAIERYDHKVVIESFYPYTMTCKLYYSTPNYGASDIRVTNNDGVITVQGQDVAASCNTLGENYRVVYLA